MKIIFHSLIVLLLVSCAKDLPQIVTTAESLETPAINLTVTATKLPPSKTPSAIRTPTNTPVSLLSTYTLPEWMSNPETNILAALITNDYEQTRKISFFNAATGENYEILMPRNVSGYFWYDNANFGLLSKDLKIAYRINMQTGQVFIEDVPEQATRLLSKGGVNGLRFIKDVSGNLSFTLVPTWNRENSKTKRFTANKKADWNGITVVDSRTQEAVWELTTPQGVYVTEFAWSPVNDSILAYIQGKPDLPSDLITKDTALTFVDVMTGNTVATYSGDFGTMRWSPDGNKIIYQDSRSIYRNYGIGFTDAPCILFLNLGEKRCLRSIPRLATPSGFDFLSTGLYEWGANNETVFYTYLYQSQKDYSFLGNLCV